MHFEIFEKSPTVEEYQALRASVGWHNHELSVAKLALENSQFSVCAEIDKHVIGCGRVVGDGHIYFYLQDVIVLPKYQRNGIGYRITEKLYELVLSVAKPGAFFGLMAAEGVSSLYEKFGFSCRSSKMPGMSIWIGASPN